MFGHAEVHTVLRVALDPSPMFEQRLQQQFPIVHLLLRFGGVPNSGVPCRDPRREAIHLILTQMHSQHLKMSSPKPSFNTHILNLRPFSSRH